MYENGFFDYVDDVLNSELVKRDINESARICNNYVIVLSDVEKALELNKSLRFVNYFVEITNNMLNYCSKNREQSFKDHNTVVLEIKKEIERHEKRIELFLNKKGVSAAFVARVSKILVFYGIVKYYDFISDVDAPKEYINLYNILLSGYIPCGWAGKIPIGGSLYVY